MSIAKFIPGKINQWQHHKTDDLDIWIAGYDSFLLLKKFIDNITNYKNINKKLIKTLLQSINNHFGIITNKYGARHFVSWHTLACEYKNLKSNWQKLKF